MTAREYLSGYLSAKKELQYLTEEVKSLAEIAVNITPAYGAEAVKHSRNVNKIPQSVERLDDLQQQYEREIVKAVSVMESVRASIAAVPDKRASRALFLRYILGRQHKEIAFDLQVSPETEARLIKKGEQQIKIPDMP